MKNGSVSLMFFGAVVMAFFLFVELQISFGLWVTGFIIGMVMAATGAIMGMIYLAKSIKADKERKDAENQE